MLDDGSIVTWGFDISGEYNAVTLEAQRGDVQHIYSIQGVAPTFTVFAALSFGIGSCRAFFHLAVFSGTPQVGARRRPGPHQFSAEP